VLGLGFTLTEEEAREWIEEDPRNAEVLFPYINGDDLNSDPQQRASRWVINFWDWSEERAKTYATPYQRVLERVKPERDLLKGNPTADRRRERWWQYGRDAKALYHAIGRGHVFEDHPRGWNSQMRPMGRVLTCSQVSKHLILASVSNNAVFDQRLVVFTTTAPAFVAVLHSSIHEVWARKQSATLETRLTYTPTSSFETFSFPHDIANSEQIREVGNEYMDTRKRLLLTLSVGLRNFYNRFHDPDDHDERLEEFRDLHRRMDRAVADAYGWTLLDLEHDFHEVPYLPANDRVQFTISEAARREVLSLLSALNRERYAEEQREAAENHTATSQQYSRRRRVQAANRGQDSLW
jgi:hypothetical protein